ncbi:MAG: family 16 glycoside hydrolase, partial [Planctomycetota bacterium]
SGKWHTIKIEHRGNHIRCHLNGQKLLDVKDDTFAEAGGIGLWTKADAVTSFDDLAVTQAPEKQP